MEGKPFWESKTFWFNLLALVVAVASAFGYREFQPDPEVLQLAVGIIALINLLLRFVTKQPIRMR